MVGKTRCVMQAMNALVPMLLTRRAIFLLPKGETTISAQSAGHQLNLIWLRKSAPAHACQPLKRGQGDSVALALTAVTERGSSR